MTSSMSTRAASVGDTLRRARAERGVTLAQAEAALHSRPGQLQALEADDYRALPPAVYTKMLLREYARFLGINPSDVLDVPMPMRPEDRDPIRPALQALDRPAFVSWKVFATVAVLAACGGLLMYLSSQYNSFVESVEGAPARTTERTVTPASRGISSIGNPIVGFPTETPPPIPTSEPVPTQVVAPLVIEARLIERSWVQVWTDGRQVIAETLPAGTTRLFAADQSVRMRVSNAGGVDVSMNGTPQGRLGNVGQAVEANWGRE